MSATFVLGGTTVAPIAVTDYQSDQEARTIVHPILGRAEPDITLRPAALRTGTLNLVFDSETASNAARVAFAQTLGVWQATSPERSSINMKFVVVGRIGRALGSASEWTITVGYQELPA